MANLGCPYLKSLHKRDVATLRPFDMRFEGEPSAGIPAVCWTLKPNADPGYNLFDLVDRLRIYGWQVPAYTLPANCDTLVMQRILVRQGVSRDLADLLLTDFRKAIDHLQSHPTAQPLDNDKASGFHH